MEGGDGGRDKSEFGGRKCYQGRPSFCCPFFKSIHPSIMYLLLYSLSPCCLSQRQRHRDLPLAGPLSRCLYEVCARSKQESWRSTLVSKGQGPLFLRQHPLAPRMCVNRQLWSQAQLGLNPSNSSMDVDSPCNILMEVPDTPSPCF